MTSLRLHILTPEKTLVDASVSAVSLPGTQAPFEVLPGHAPLISSLERGEIRYVEGGEPRSVPIVSGFVEIAADQVEVCAEV